MNSVFVLQHMHEMDDGDERIKFIGVYSSRMMAQAAIDRLSCAPGFSETPNGFHIDEYRIDQDHWAEGYITVADAMSSPATREAEGSVP
jgi:hypothetical protein